MRIVPTLAEWPDASFLFGYRYGVSFGSWEFAPAWFRDLMAWFGVSGEIHWAREPTLVGELRVAPQAEQLGHGPDTVHLDRMTELAERNIGRQDRQGTLFVSRAGTFRPIAGEDYLEDVMALAGVRVIRPETMTIREQAVAYASAERLIFTEGSAIHGLQLLGRGVGDVLVLNRRHGARLARESVEPRARSLTYAEAASGMVLGTAQSGQEAPWLGIALFDESVLLESLAGIGVELRSFWDAGTLAVARDRAVMRWIEEESASPRGSAPNFRETVVRTLHGAGLGHLSGSVG